MNLSPVGMFAIVVVTAFVALAAWIAKTTGAELIVTLDALVYSVPWVVAVWAITNWMLPVFPKAVQLAIYAGVLGWIWWPVLNSILG